MSWTTLQSDPEIHPHPPLSQKVVCVLIISLSHSSVGNTQHMHLTHITVHCESTKQNYDEPGSRENSQNPRRMKIFTQFRHKRNSTQKYILYITPKKKNHRGTVSIPRFSANLIFRQINATKNRRPNNKNSILFRGKKTKQPNKPNFFGCVLCRKNHQNIYENKIVISDLRNVILYNIYKPQNHIDEIQTQIKTNYYNKMTHVA